MENRKDYEKRLGERLEAAYMQEDIGPVMSREEFHGLIQTAEKKKKHRRTMLSLAAASVALCLVCGGFVAGMTMRESASAGKDDETKTVQQGGSVVIGSGVSEKDQNVGMSTKTYTNIEDIPEDIRKEIHFLDSDDFELEKVKVVESKRAITITSFYWSGNIKIEIEQIDSANNENMQVAVIKQMESQKQYNEITIYLRELNECIFYFWEDKQALYSVKVYSSEEDLKIEAILDDLY